MISDNKGKRFIQEFYNEDKKVVARWHYDLDKFRNGPILVENLDLPRKETTKKKKR